MPRPGPRPYECVKRAWHSDRHQPIRGSIIRQIFRLALEAHGSGTRKNKEWQEKLPVVVLRAEEIMYSKANSEEEYTDADSLWNRVSDAIDTIIRRDESTESGPLLPPCVEAALNLGCIAVRASRSQRHSNLRTYLGPRFQDPVSNEPYPEYHQSHTSIKPNHTVQAIIPVDVLDNRNKHTTPPCAYPFLHEPTQMREKPLARSGTSSAPVNLGSVYPLYYGGNSQTQQLDMSLQVPEETNAAAPIIIGMPVGISISCQSEKAPEEEATERVCDLSLRLGISSEHCTRISNLRDTESNPSNKAELCFFSDLFSNYGAQNTDWREKHHLENK